MTAATSPEERRRLNYRPHLDGLRAVAVGLVVLYHLGVMPGGGVGVTIFFVLSGYLITTLLVRERNQTGGIKLRAFYVRRVRRLFPALALVMAAVFAVMALIGHPSPIPWLFVVTALYLGNFAEAGGADLGAFSHTWSLAIEEQFYLAWPFLLLGLFRLPRVWAAAGLVVLAGVIMAARVAIASQGSLDAAMYPTHLRADALLLGCALALVPRSAPRWAVWVGAAGLILSLALPSPWAVSLAAVSTLPLLVAPIRVLEWTPLVYVGVISYGVYLWHLPVIYALSPFDLLWLTIPLTLLLAAASYHLWERRFLVRRSASAQSGVYPAATGHRPYRNHHRGSEAQVPTGPVS
jgi:peptidoglycan/LPS O-acetylase OafA/YrhL